jgi:hypothetical protein
MNELYISRDIISIIRKYLTISKRNVNRNYKLVLTEIEYLNEFNGSIIHNSRLTYLKFCYCYFCDKITNYYENIKYSIDSKFISIGRNIKYVNIIFSCSKCFITCDYKFVVLEQLKRKQNL